MSKAAEFAKKQLEKYGWKEGEGLGKDGQGTSTFVRAFKPRGERGEHIGIGHEATKGSSNSDMGYGKVLSELARAKPAASSSDSESDAEGKLVVRKAKVHRPEGAQSSSSSSSSSTSSDSSDDDVLGWDDAKLFAKCNGVRLGRTGRHRFFDGKVARIAEHDASTSGHNPYANPPPLPIKGKKGTRHGAPSATKKDL